jgi:hypothetical protein
MADRALSRGGRPKRIHREIPGKPGSDATHPTERNIDGDHRG